MGGGGVGEGRSQGEDMCGSKYIAYSVTVIQWVWTSHNSTEVHCAVWLEVQVYTRSRVWTLFSGCKEPSEVLEQENDRDQS